MCSRTTELEGVIKYKLHHLTSSITIPSADFEELEAWRQIIYQLGGVGQDEFRYGGLGFGNLSLRSSVDRRIWVTGTQTSGQEVLGLAGYCLIKSVDITRNELFSEGMVKPSSEAMTHAALYEAAPWIGGVIHIHHPLMWTLGESHLDMACVAASIPYGTPEMAIALQQTVTRAEKQPQLVVMHGHEDGVIGYGSNLLEVGIKIVATLARAKTFQLAENL
jgi:L-ribulose-5-phosphate 4-epimerase